MQGKINEERRWAQLPEADVWVIQEPGHKAHTDLSFLEEKGFDYIERHRGEDIKQWGPNHSGKEEVEEVLEGKG